ncbi:MAG: hypothetical protein ACSLFK_09285 [Gemmatimonadaceae bacterium]
MYKDAIHEGFGVATFARSIAIGTSAAITLQSFLGLPLPAPWAIVLLFGLAYGTERGIVEIWKTFIRNEDQSRYFIPMQFCIRGVPVTSRWVRSAAGAVCVVAIALSLVMVAQMNDNGATFGNMTRAALAGLVVGMLIAAGGSWKDAPKEGFDFLKFFRSPALTVIFACIVSQFTTDLLLIAVAAVGYERAAAETWKTFFFPSVPRGKFTGKPVLHPAFARQRQYFVPVYVAISAGMIALGAAAL